MLIGLLVGIVVSLLGLSGNLLDFLIKPLPGMTEGLSIFIQSILTTMIYLVINPITLIAHVLLYYDLRIRKEGFDLILLAESLGPEKDSVDNLMKI